MPSRRLSCAVGVCNNYYIKTKKLLYEGYPITYHYFPRSTDLCNRWIEACNRAENFKAEVCFVCSIHFRSDDFTKQPTDSISSQPKRRLKYNAVPTRNLTLDEMRSFVHRKNLKKTKVFSDLKAVNKSGRNNNSKIMKNSDSISDNEIITMEKNCEKLLKEYEDLKINSKIEIERLKSMIKEKDEIFTTKLRKILSEHLTETEIDLVLFLRKQKKELADS
ncbi:unnamed protein product [Nezara viridula]|uniref:THAP-type domain-containing protein n=1 Tax=Nezara viridula TaxID=85310 RepID=A0A9P0MQX7_NEZVI|nr:unnamed protein product [Nezara viridula]